MSAFVAHNNGAVIAKRNHCSIAYNLAAKNQSDIAAFEKHLGHRLCAVGPAHVV